MQFSAAFLDRDGTIIRDAGYVEDPSDVELVPGAAEAVSLLNARGIPVVIVTNQSGIGRGYYTEKDFRAVQEEVERQLAMHGCAVDSVQHCPHAPDEPCGCRKPDLGMHRAAADRLGVALEEALYVGDKVSDILPAVRTGGTGYLLRTGHEPHDQQPPEGVRWADDLLTAVVEALGLGAGEDDD